MKNKIHMFVISIIVVICVVLLGTVIIRQATWQERADINDLYGKLDVKEQDVKKGKINFTQPSLYDELADIDKYPLSLEGKADVVLEVFSSPEKVGEGYERWLLEMSKKYNAEKHKVAGKTVAVSVRPVSSGMGADYIISKKHVPDIYTPSSDLWGAYIDVNGGKVQMLSSRLVGNVAGILVQKGKGYKSVEDVSKAVSDGKINIGYTNPNESTTGMNLLLTLLKSYDSSNMFSDRSKEEFTKFQNNIPYIGTTTMQLRNSLKGGKMDGMVLEYQTYINEKDLSSVYDFIPFGVRHDSPAYLCKADTEKYASDYIEYLLSDESQKVASSCGFNENNGYKSSYDVIGSEVSKSLEFYKQNKDSGKPVVAVFVSDRSGSMEGEPITRLKDSISNGMQYISDTNYVGMVSYSSDLSIDVPIAKMDMNQRAYIQGALNSMSANGGTNICDGVVVGLKMLQDAKKTVKDCKPVLFVLSDGAQTGGYNFSNVEKVIKESGIPIFTIGYNISENESSLLKDLSSVNESASINADNDDIMYYIKSLFNSSL